MRGILSAAGLGLAIAGAASSHGQTIASRLVVNGLVRPIYVTHSPGDYGRIFIIEKQGRIRIAQITPSGSYTLLPTPFLDIDAIVTGGTTNNSEQGLLGLAFHPDYAANGRFYVNYTAVTGSGDTVVAEYTVSADPNVANPTGNIILTFDQPQANHNGGWIEFGPDGMLYVATGDGGNFNDQGSGHTEPGGNAQDITSNLLGKILRINVNGDDFPADANRDYAIPADNPFVGIEGDDEIWAFGLRNPWRPSFDRATGDLYIADVGQDVWEEINFQAAGAVPGRNYGWRCREGNVDFNFDSVCVGRTFTAPIWVYQHVSGACSITGGYVYRGCAIPSLEGHYFFADFCSSAIFSFRYTGTIQNFTTRTTQLAPGGGLSISTITSFGEDAYGELYICDQVGGEVFKIVPSGAPATDCNGNGVDDQCEVLDGSAADADGDGVLDACECVGDVDGNNQTDLSDLSQLLAGFGACTGDPAYNAAADLNASGCVDLGDLSLLLSGYGCAN
ncbi:MAG: hypothetical protein AMXMBFR47_28710 [Planctomycetota bacterium]